MIIDNNGIIASFKNSAKLVWGYWWRTFALLFFYFIVFHFLVAFIEDIFHLPMMLNMHSAEVLKTIGVTNYVAAFLATVLAWPLFFTLWLCQYHELKIRYRLKHQSDKLIESLNHF